MPRLNEHYLNLRASYLFAEIKERTKAFTDAHPGARLINLGIGDVTQPLPPAVIRALHEATDEMARAETFRGYGPYAGYDFLLSEIARHDFASRGVALGLDEIFVSDGGKSDSANLQELFATDCVVALIDPVYPVYADSNVLAGRCGPADASGRYAGFVYLPCTAENGFQPALPDRHVDLIYLCFPNNPTGAVATRQALRRWVDYARAEDAIIIYDAAYEAYIRDADVPHSIYEIDGAREVAIECRSFSKSAGFTGLRLAYTVVPKETRGRTADGRSMSINPFWQRRVAIKYNGAALHRPEGGRRRLHAGGAEGGAGPDRLLPGQCADHRRRAAARWLHRARRPQCALRMAAHARRPLVVGLLHRGAGEGPGGRCARLRVRPERRGLFPLQRVRLARGDGGGCRADRHRATLRQPRSQDRSARVHHERGSVTKDDSDMRALQTSVRDWPGLTMIRGFAPSTQLAPGSSTAEADRTRNAAGSRPGGRVP